MGLAAYILPMRIDIEPNARPAQEKFLNYSQEQRDFLSCFMSGLVKFNMVYLNTTSKWTSAPLLVHKHVLDSQWICALWKNTIYQTSSLWKIWSTSWWGWQRQPSTPSFTYPTGTGNFRYIWMRKNANKYWDLMASIHRAECYMGQLMRSRN